MWDYFRSRMRLIEEVFGNPFLSRCTNPDLKPTGKQQHLLRYHWRVAKKLSESAGPKSTDLRSASLAWIVLAAESIGLQSISGFDACIRGRLKEWEQFDAAYYEVQAAIAFRRYGTVEFVPTDKTKTPDLKVSRDDQTMFVECNRKDRISPERLNNAMAKMYAAITS